MEESRHRARQIALAYAVSVGVWVSIALLLEPAARRAEARKVRPRSASGRD
jgi:hypothetical protein